MGKLIVLEGLDGSGKKTQAELLVNRLKTNKVDVQHLEYPNYDSKSSELVKMYLKGEISSSVEEISPYLSSVFFAADRGISYIKEWKELYENTNTIFIADRYTTSNMLYQAAKIQSLKEKEDYLNWLWDLEFNKIQIPVPDLVLFLDVSSSITRKLTENRPSKIDNNNTKDIHENNPIYQEESYNNSKYLIDKYSWIQINCMNSRGMKGILEIHQEIYEKVNEFLKNKAEV